MSDQHSFTLIELLIVIGILAILVAAVVVILNPAQLLAQARDSKRQQDLSALRNAINTVEALSSSMSFGASSTVYTSLLDTTTTCANLGLPTIAPYVYHCVTSSDNLVKTNGTGWVPIDFTQNGVASLSALPTDPVNTSSTGLYYTYVTGGSFELTALLESQSKHDAAINDGGSLPGVYEIGSNLSLTPPTRDMGLVGYWPFDEGTGTVAYDRSGNGNNGAVIGGNPGRLTGVLCKVNNCLSSVAGDRINILDSPSLDIPSVLTIAAWFYPVGPNNDYAYFPISKQNSTADANYVWYWFGGGSPNPGLNGLLANMGGTWSYASYGFTISPATYNTAWSHVVYTYQAGVGGKTYINGSLVGVQTTLKQNLAINTANIYLTPGNARLDDLRIYNRALSASEISALYNATK